MGVRGVVIPTPAPIAKNKWHQQAMDAKAARSWSTKKAETFNIRVIRDCHNGDIIIVNKSENYTRTAIS